MRSWLIKRGRLSLDKSVPENQTNLLWKGVDESHSTNPRVHAGPAHHQPEPYLVRTEELSIVIVVLLLWLAAIALFINRWGKIRQMEPYHPYFEPTPAAAAASADNGGTNSHRPSIFEAPLIRRASQSPLPGSAAAGSASGNNRRLSNISVGQYFYQSPPTLALPPGQDRRLSVFLPQPPLQGQRGRRASCFLFPEPGMYSAVSPQSTKSNYLSPRVTNPSQSRRTSVCTAAEYLMRAEGSPLQTAGSTGSKSRLMSAASLLSVSKEEKSKLLSVNSSHSKLQQLVPEVRCTLASPEVPRNDPAHEEEDEGSDKNSLPSSRDRIEDNYDKEADEKDVVSPLNESALKAGLDRARRRREAFRTFSMKQSEV